MQIKKTEQNQRVYHPKYSFEEETQGNLLMDQNESSNSDHWKKQYPQRYIGKIQIPKLLFCLVFLCLLFQGGQTQTDCTSYLSVVGNTWTVTDTSSSIGRIIITTVGPLSQVLFQTSAGDNNSTSLTYNGIYTAVQTKLNSMRYFIDTQLGTSPDSTTTLLSIEIDDNSGTFVQLCLDTTHFYLNSFVENTAPKLDSSKSSQYTQSMQYYDSPLSITLSNFIIDDNSDSITYPTVYINGVEISSSGLTWITYTSGVIKFDPAGTKSRVLNYVITIVAEDSYLAESYLNLEVDVTNYYPTYDASYISFPQKFVDSVNINFGSYILDPHSIGTYETKLQDSTNTDLTYPYYGLSYSSNKLSGTLKVSGEQTITLHLLMWYTSQPDYSDQEITLTITAKTCDAVEFTTSGTLQLVSNTQDYTQTLDITVDTTTYQPWLLYTSTSLPNDFTNVTAYEISNIAGFASADITNINTFLGKLRYGWTSTISSPSDVKLKIKLASKTGSYDICYANIDTNTDAASFNLGLFVQEYAPKLDTEPTYTSSMHYDDTVQTISFGSVFTDDNSGDTITYTLLVNGSDPSTYSPLITLDTTNKEIKITPQSLVTYCNTYIFTLEAKDDYLQVGTFDLTIIIVNENPVFDQTKTTFTYYFMDDLEIILTDLITDYEKETLTISLKDSSSGTEVVYNSVQTWLSFDSTDPSKQFLSGTVKVSEPQTIKLNVYFKDPSMIDSLSQEITIEILALQCGADQFSTTSSYLQLEGTTSSSVNKISVTIDSSWLPAGFKFLINDDYTDKVELTSSDTQIATTLGLAGDLSTINQILEAVRYTNTSEITDPDTIMLNVSVEASSYQICNTNNKSSVDSRFTLTSLQYNHVPKVESPIANKTMKVMATETISLTGVFSDSDSDTLTNEVLVDGGTVAQGNSQLLSWIAFDQTAGTLTFTPQYDNFGNFSMQIVALDTYGESTYFIFNLTVENDPPEFISDNYDYWTSFQQEFSLDLSQIITDSQSETITFTIYELKDDTDVSLTENLSWLSFDSSTHILSGTVLVTESSTYQLNIYYTTAYLNSNLNQTINLHVTEYYCSETDIVITQSTKEISIQVTDLSKVIVEISQPQTTIQFIVPNSDYTYLQEGKNEVIYNVADTVDSDFIKNYLQKTLRYNLIDKSIVITDVLLTFKIFKSSGAYCFVNTNSSEVSTDINLSLLNANQVPEVNATSLIHLIHVGSTSYFQINEQFNEPDNDVLTFVLALDESTTLPTWITYDSTTNKITFTPTLTELNNFTLSVTATDTYGSYISADLALEVYNNLPYIKTEQRIFFAKLSNEIIIYMSDLLADNDGDSLNIAVMQNIDDEYYSLSTNIKWLSYYKSTKLLRGTPDTVDSFSLTIFFNDSYSNNQTLTIQMKVVEDENQFPYLIESIANYTLHIGQEFSLDFKSHIYDCEGDTITIELYVYDTTAVAYKSLSSILPWLTYDSTVLTLAGSTTTGTYLKTYLIKVAYTDRSDSYNYTTFTLELYNNNPKPNASAVYDSEVYLKYSEYLLYQFPSNIVYDQDSGDVISYYLYIYNETSLTWSQISSAHWIKFNSANLSIYGDSNEASGSAVYYLGLGYKDPYSDPDSSEKITIKFTLSQCESYQVYNETAKSCTDCGYECSACSLTNNDQDLQCDECNSGFYVQSGTKACFKECNPEYYLRYNSTLEKQECYACSATQCSICYISDIYDQTTKDKCYACVDGYYLNQSYLCSAVPTCESGYYLSVSYYDLYRSTEKCVVCPAGCDECAIGSTTSLMTCLACSNTDEVTYVLNSEGQCISSVLNGLTVPTCTSTQYLFLDREAAQYTCIDCSKTCTSCTYDENQVETCLQCADNYYYNATQKACLSNAGSCSTGSYLIIKSTSGDMNCESCPEGCTSCILLDPTNILTMNCLTCGTKYTTYNVVYNTVTYQRCKFDSTKSCESDQYNITVSDIIYCLSCPEQCAACSYNKDQDTIQCNSCNTGYYYDSANLNCISICQESYYYDTTLLSCVACASGCLQCSGSLSKDCTVYSESTTQTSSTTLNCSSSAYPNSDNTGCICYDSTKWFNSTDNTCKSLSSITGSQCGLGQAYDSVFSSCVSCDADSLCKVCAFKSTSSPQPTCYSCISGYYLNSDTNVCKACSSHCQSCTNSYICDKCEPGYFVYQSTSLYDTKECVASCPSGTIHQVVSVLTLNDDIFTLDQLASYLGVDSSIIFTESDTSKSSTSSDLYIKPSVAVGVYDESIFSYSELPYQLDSNYKNPTISSQLIRVQCTPCLKYCDSCDDGYLLLTDTHECYKSLASTCPAGYAMDYSLSNACSKITSTNFAIYQISALTLNRGTGYQPLGNKLVMNAVVNASDSLQDQITYKWAVSSISIIDFTNKQSTEVTDVQLLSKLYQQLTSGVDLNEQKLTIPGSNIQKEIMANFTLTVTLLGKSLSQSICIYIKDCSETSTLESLGINSNLTGVTPQEGTAGTQKFTAKYNFESASIFSEGTYEWQYSIEISDYSLIYTSSSIKDSLSFYAPANYNSSQYVTVVFRAKSGDESYTTSRTIYVKNNTGLTSTTVETQISSLPYITNVTNSSSNTGNLTEFEVLQAAISVKTSQYILSYSNNCSNAQDFFTSNSQQDVCSPDEESPCCGNGKCQKVGNSTRYSCVCNSTYSGVMCHTLAENLTLYQDATDYILEYINTTEINSSNIDTLMKAIKVVTQTNIITSENQEELQDILTKMATMENSDPTTDLYQTQLSLVQQVKNSVDQSNQITSTSFSDSLTSIQNYLNISAKILSNLASLAGESENTEYQYEDEDISVEQQFISNGSSLYSVTLDYNTTSPVTIGSSALQNLSYIIVDKLLQKGDVNKRYDQDTILVAPSIIVSVYNSSTKQPVSINVTNYNFSSSSESCPLQYNLTVDFQYKNKGVCGYFDEKTNKMSSSGCKVINVRDKIVNETSEISCCCNHMTMVSVYASITDIDDDDDDNTDDSDSYYLQSFCPQIYERSNQQDDSYQDSVSSLPLLLDICECPIEDKMSDSFKCESYSDPYFILKYVNFIFILFPVLMMFKGQYLFNSLRFIAYSQIISLLVFVNHPDFFRHKNMIEVFRVDNIAPIFPSIFGYAVDKEYNDRRYLDVKNQIPPLSFFEQGYSSNYLINLGPLIIVYAIFICSIPVAAFYYRNQGQQQGSTHNSPDTSQLSNNKKYSSLTIYIINGFIAVFMLTFQEELMLIALQFQNINFSNALNSLGFVMALIGLVFHILPLVGLYIYQTLLFRKQFTNQQKLLYGSFFDKTPLSQGYNSLISHANNIIFMVARILIISTVIDNRYTLNQVFFISCVSILVCISIYQYISHQKTYQAEKTNQNQMKKFIELIMYFVPDLLMLMSIPYVIGVEYSRKINASNFSDHKSIYRYVLIYLIIFFAIKLIIIFFDIFYYLIQPKPAKGKLISQGDAINKSTSTIVSQAKRSNMLESSSQQNQNDNNNRFVVQNQTANEESKNNMQKNDPNEQIYIEDDNINSHHSQQLAGGQQQDKIF